MENATKGSAAAEAGAAGIIFGEKQILLRHGRAFVGVRFFPYNGDCYARISSNVLQTIGDCTAAIANGVLRVTGSCAASIKENKLIVK